ncbi:MAG TPA: hypothetical protein VFW87_12795 [Pirellulales bacterium]|nr:hypothetical protein [Pirellulales bacterium]
MNVQGHTHYIRRLLEGMGLWSLLMESNIQFITLAELRLPYNIDDATLWRRCQDDRWVLFTDNRNRENNTSLQAAISSMSRPGDLPVLTLSGKGKFERFAEYRQRVAIDIADLLLGILDGEFCDRDRIYVPR